MKRCIDCPNLITDEAIQESADEARDYDRKRSEVKADEDRHRALGKLPKGESYEATWNYYEGIAEGIRRTLKRL